MSDEAETPLWLAESITQLESVRMDRPTSARELRRRSVRRRRRRTHSAVIFAVAVTAFGAGAYWNFMRADRSVEESAHRGETSEMAAAREKMRAYYSALPDAFVSRDSTSKLWKLMTTHFTDTAMKQEAVLEGSGADGPAATCGQVDGTTTFTVGDLHRAGNDTVRAHVTSSSAPESIEVDFDLRTMKIAKWSCPDGP